MAISANETGELGLYSKEADDLAARVEELEKFRQQADQFNSLEVSLRLERQELNATILDSTSPDDLIGQLDKLDKSRRLNAASAEALSQRIRARESYLHERLPLALKAFQPLRDFVSFSVLESCRQKVRALIDPDYVVADEHIDAICVTMPDFIRVNRLKLPSISWTITRPLDEKPIAWNSLARPFSDQEWAAERSGIVSAILATATALCAAGKALVVACGPYAQGCPPFKCEPEVQTPAQPDPKYLEWLQPLGGSDEEFCRQICETAGKPYPPTNPTDIEILARMLENRHANPISHGIVTGEMVGSTFVEQ